MDNDLISRSALREDIIIAQANLATDNDKLWEINKKYYKGLAIAHGLVIQAPAVDAVEVIRCKDCENFGCSPFSYSVTIGWCKLEGCHHRLDYYCASAEKRNKTKAGE